ncbi:DUF4892 domain-containing protein [Aurantivibrio infirmus]
MLSNTNRLRARVLIVVGMFVFSSTLRANPSLSEIEDMLSIFPRAELVATEQLSPSNYQLALGRVEKNRGVWMPEKEKRLSGELTRITLQIPDGYTASDAFTFYRKRFEAHDAQTIFYCENRNCGSSNSWANNIFGIKQLYGLDNDQLYGVFEVPDTEGHLHYLVMYAVARGNKRIYTQIEWLKTRVSLDDGIAPDAEVIIEQINSQGYFIVSGLNLSEANSPLEPSIEIHDDYLASLVSALRKDRRLKLRIVGHDYSANNLSAQTQRSLHIAKQLREKLIAAGIKDDRIEAHGVGSLAPAKGAGRRDVDEDSANQFRLEIIKAED